MIAVAIVVLVATVALYAYGGDSDDDFRDLVPGDTIVIEITEGSETYLNVYTVIGEYDGMYAVGAAYDSQSDPVYIFLYEKPVESILIGEFTDPVKIGTEIIQTPFGDIECDVYRDYDADMNEIIVYIGENGITYRQIYVNEDRVVNLTSTTIFDDPKGIVEPSFEMPAITELEVKDDVSVGDFRESVTDGESQLITVIDVVDDMVTIEMNGMTETMVKETFLDSFMKIEYFDLDIMEYYRSIVWATTWGNIVVDEYHIVSDDSTVFKYFFEANSGILMQATGFYQYYINDTNLFIGYIDGISNTPRTQPIVGDYLEFTRTYSNGDVNVYSDMIMGFLNGEYIELYTLNTPEGTFEGYYIYDDLAGICGYDLEDYHYICNEVIDTEFGAIECGKYETDVNGHIDTMWIDSLGIIYRYVCSDGYVEELTACTLFMPAKDVPEPTAEIPEFTGLQIDGDALAVGDTITFYDYALETEIIYEVIAIDGDVVTYTVGEMIDTCTVTEFYGFIMGAWDVDLSDDPSFKMLVGNSWGTVVCEYYEIDGMEYYIDYWSGIILYMYNESEGWALIDSTLISSLDEVPEPREQPVVGDYILILGAEGDIGYAETYTVVDTCDYGYVIEHERFDSDDNHIFEYLICDSLVFAPLDSPYWFIEYRAEYIDTIYGYMECYAYKDVYIDGIDISYIGPGSIIYRWDSTNGDRWVMADTSLFTPVDEVPAPTEIPVFGDLSYKENLEVGDKFSYVFNDGVSTTLEIVATDGDMVTTIVAGEQYECTAEEFLGYIETKDDFELMFINYTKTIIAETVWGNVIVDVYEDEDGYEIWFDKETGVLLYEEFDDDLFMYLDSNILVYTE